MMSIIKNEIPILEFDTDKSAIIEPMHSNYVLKLPKKTVFAFLHDAKVAEKMQLSFIFLACALLFYQEAFHKNRGRHW